MKAAVPLRLLRGACLLALSGMAMGQNAFTTHSAEVYAGPDDSYPVVAQLDSDSPVDVVGCLDDWSWCDVMFEDNRGWVYAPDIIYQYQGGFVPLYSYAPGLGIPVVQFTIGGYWDHYYRGRPWYAQRAEWLHRERPEHHRPSGPRPSAAPPPLSARVEKPARDGRPFRDSERSFRLGGAESPHRETPPPARAGETPRHDAKAERAEPPQQSTHPENTHPERMAAPPPPREAMPARPEAPPARDNKPERTEAPPPREARPERPALPRQEAKSGRAEPERSSVRPERRESKPDQPKYNP